jgi:hypothetical protein
MIKVSARDSVRLKCHRIFLFLWVYILYGPIDGFTRRSCHWDLFSHLLKSKQIKISHSVSWFLLCQAGALPCFSCWVTLHKNKSFFTFCWLHISYMNHTVLKSSVKPINLVIHVTQIVNLHTNKVSRILGKVENNERFLRIALYQGDKGNKKVRKIPSVAANVNDSKEPLSDPTLLCCAFKKHRIYLFRYATQSSPESFLLASSIVFAWWIPL